jgi:hypothetical protein
MFSQIKFKGITNKQGRYFFWKPTLSGRHMVAMMQM